MRQCYVLAKWPLLIVSFLFLYCTTTTGQQVMLQNKKHHQSAQPRQQSVDLNGIRTLLKQKESTELNALFKPLQQQNNPTLQDSLNLKVLRYLRDSLPARDTAILEDLNQLIDSIKQDNFLEFITSLKRPKPFYIKNIGQYNIDSINAYLYDQIKYGALQNVGLQNYSGTTVISGELASIYMGALRLGVGGAVNTTGDTARDNAIKTNLQKILINGGQITANFSVPLFYLRSRKSNFHFGIFAHSVFGFNPGFDSTTQQTSFSNAFLFSNKTGLQFHLEAGAANNGGGAYIDLPIEYVWGNYYNNMGLKDFGVVHLKAGFAIQGLVNLSISGPLFTSSSIIKRLPYVLSLQFSPSAIVSKD